MPEFIVTGPDGKKYRVTGENAEGAKAAVKKRTQPPAAAASMASEPVWSGAILPISKDAAGNVSFDSNAGIVGAAKRAFTLPGEVYEGKVDLNSPEGQNRALEMATMVIPPSRFGARVLPPAAPSAETLKHVGGKLQMGKAAKLGVDYSSDAVRNGAAALRVQLERDGFHPSVAHKSYAILKDLANPPPGSVAPLAGIDAARKALRNAQKDFANPAEQEVAGRIIRALDNFVENPPPKSVVAGPAAEAAKLNKEGRANYAAGKRSDRLQGVEYAADRRAAAANSGQNIDNAIRTRVASILLDPKKRAGFSKSEIALLEKVADGTGGRNLLRWFGNVLGGGGGLGAMVTSGIGGLTGAFLGGPVGGAIGAGIGATTGTALKRAGGKATKRALHKADEAVRSRSPLADKMPPQIQNPGPVGRGVVRGVGQSLAPNPNFTTEEEYLEYLRRGGA